MSLSNSFLFWTGQLFGGGFILNIWESLSFGKQNRWYLVYLPRNTGVQGDVLKRMTEKGEIARNLRCDGTQVNLRGRLIFNFKGDFTLYNHFCRFHGGGTHSMKHGWALKSFSRCLASALLRRTALWRIDFLGFHYVCIYSLCSFIHLYLFVWLCQVLAAACGI